MSGPVLNTIVLNFRTPDLSLMAVEGALREMEGIAGGVTLVDNDSGDGSFEKMRAEAEARGWLASGRLAIVESGHNGGFGAGNNYGIRQGTPDGRRADLVYLLNSDAIPQPGAIRVLIDYLAAHPKAGIVCSRIRGMDGEPHHTAFRFPSVAGEFEATTRIGPVSRLLRNRIVAMPQPDHSLRVDWSAGASMMMRAEVLDQIGLFDEGFFLYFEETDLCRRAADAGWETHYVWESEIAHIGSASTGMKKWGRVPDYWYDSRRRYFEKHHGRAGALFATAAHVAGTGLWRLRCLIQRQPHGAPEGHLGLLTRHALRRQPKPAHFEKGQS
ncbi:glycosyltransferase family 2 protein [Paracoccus aminophilus]|uniref:Glycosyl transferase n=1 Tax=Paracoccus aminophilus JCM 7686 TaxID=1367847 RepID=S5YFC2_PARAH|nr:glycosyltransferase family 2 protein [Paracoccus aminophilus]AGT10173.1 glycosyl transferase [Paracoccus aminophilus JCM 7686]